MQLTRASLACVRLCPSRVCIELTRRWLWTKEKARFLLLSSHHAVYFFWQRGGDWDVLWSHHRGGIQMIAGLTAAACLSVCVCVLLKPFAHTCTDDHMCTHHPGNETVCLPCITYHSQLWQAMKRLSTFNMQLEFLCLFQGHAALSPRLIPPHLSDHQITRLSENRVKCHTPSFPPGLLWGPGLNMST